MHDELPTMEEIEAEIPDDRKNLSFGGEGESVLDVMDRKDKEAHHRGQHMNEENECCPWCPDPDNERVSPTVTGDSA